MDCCGYKITKIYAISRNNFGKFDINYFYSSQKQKLYSKVPICKTLNCIFFLFHISLYFIMVSCRIRIVHETWYMFSYNTHVVQLDFHRFSVKVEKNGNKEIFYSVLLYLYTYNKEKIFKNRWRFLMIFHFYNTLPKIFQL